MAQGSVVHRVRAEVADVDRGFYGDVDVRLARHPSETARNLVARALVYCLEQREGLEVAGALCDGDEPAFAVVGPDGARLRYVDVGLPSADRLHRATKAWAEVAVYCPKDAAALRAELGRRAVHRVESIEAYAMPASVLDPLAESLERTLTLQVVRTDGQLLVTSAGRTVSGELERIALG